MSLRPLCHDVGPLPLPSKGRPCRSVLALLALAAACALGGVTETPLNGPAPRAVLVLPPRDGTGIPRRDLRGLASQLDRALQQRGYRSLPIDVGFDLARQAGWGASDAGASTAPDAAMRQRLLQAAAVDAVLELTMDRWDATGERPLRSAEWDWTWRLVALADGAELWRHREQGQYHMAPQDQGDRTQAPDAEPATLPFGTLRPRAYRDATELAAALHRAAMARLPQRSS